MAEVVSEAQGRWHSYTVIDFSLTDYLLIVKIAVSEQ